MGKARKHTPEQIVNILRQIEVAVSNGKTAPVASREAGITEQSYYRWRKEYGGLKVDQAKRLKELEQENSNSAWTSRFFRTYLIGTNYGQAKAYETITYVSPPVCSKTRCRRF